MALLWMDNFRPESSSTAAQWPQFQPYKKYGTDTNDTNGVIVQINNSEGSLIPTRSTDNAQVSLRTLPVPAKALPITYTVGMSIRNAVASASPNTTCQFGLIANTDNGLRALFLIRPGNGSATLGSLHYAMNGIAHTVPLAAQWPSSNDRTLKTNIEFSFTKVADDSVDEMSQLLVWVDNLLVFSGNVLNNAYRTDQLEVIVSGLVTPTSDYLAEGAISSVSLTGPGTLNSDICSTGNLYMLDDTGTSNVSRLGKVSVLQRSPNSDVTAQLSRSTGTGINAELAAQMPINSADYLYGVPDNKDEYGLEAISAGLDIRGVRTTTVAAKDDPFGYDAQPFIKTSGVTFTRDVMQLTGSANYQHIIDEVDPTTDAKWTVPRLNNTSIGVQVVEVEGE